MIERRTLDKPGRRHATVHRKSDRSVSVVQVDSTNPLTRTQRDVSWRTVVPAVVIIFIARSVAKYLSGEAAGLRVISGIVGATTAGWCISFVKNSAGGPARGVNAEFGRVMWAHLTGCIADSLAEWAYDTSDAWVIPSTHAGSQHATPSWFSLGATINGWVAALPPSGLIVTLCAIWARSVARLLIAHASVELAYGLYVHTTHGRRKAKEGKKPFQLVVFVAVVFIAPLLCTVSWLMKSSSMIGETPSWVCENVLHLTNITSAVILVLGLSLHTWKLQWSGMYGRLWCKCGRRGGTSVSVGRRGHSGKDEELERLLQNEHLNDTTCWHLNVLCFVGWAAGPARLAATVVKAWPNVSTNPATVPVMAAYEIFLPLMLWCALYKGVSLRAIAEPPSP